MRLYAVDNVFVTLEDHGQLCSVLVPDKDAPTVTSAEDKVLTPEVGLLYLKSVIIFLRLRQKCAGLESAKYAVSYSASKKNFGEVLHNVIPTIQLQYFHHSYMKYAAQLNGNNFAPS